MSFFLSALLVSSPFFQFLQFLCANSKKIKNDFPFLKNPCFLLISSTSSFLMLYIWQIFFFIGHRLNAKRSAPAFHLLTPICPDFSAIAKKGPENAENCCFRWFSVVVWIWSDSIWLKIWNRQQGERALSLLPVMFRTENLFCEKTNAYSRFTPQKTRITQQNPQFAVSAKTTKSEFFYHHAWPSYVVWSRSIVSHPP